MARRGDGFQTIRSEGGLLPPDLLRRVIDPKGQVPGTAAEDYGLPHGERINETITQSWNRLRRHWAEFTQVAQSLPEGEAGTGLTNDRWSLPLLRELGFGLLPTSAGPEVEGRTYAISRFFGPVAVHLIGCNLSLDRRSAGVRGAASANPHGLVQGFLNRAEGYLWGIVSNGLRFRILRDNQAFSRQSYLEFDLEAMFAGEVYSDFVLLWLVAHATRFTVHDDGGPGSCWLEQWSRLAEKQGARALESLKGGVEKALEALGQGFVGHPRNTALRERLRSGTLPLNDFHGQLLRVVYRLIFLFVAEGRTLEGIPVIHPRDDSDAARQARKRYAAHYSSARLRELAAHIRGSRHGDLWHQFNLITGSLSGEDRFSAARDHLALPVFGSFLWAARSTVAVNASNLAEDGGTELANMDFLEAIRHLAFTRQGKVLRPVDYKNLGSEELGGVYESLLALTPQISGDGTRFTFAEFAGNERKTSGSYYTPDSLVQCLLDSALDPVVEEAIKGKPGKEREKAILSLKVCDPAVGSGHFLVGAAHRLALHLARMRATSQGESEPSPPVYQHALRDVVSHCLYGVDINPMAAELCKVSLWLEALEPGKPLSFLDHHIRVGNSLLGTTPGLVAKGIPDDAFKPIEGDDKKACVELKKRNRGERKGLGPLFAEQDAEIQTQLARAAAELEGLPDDRPEDIHFKELSFRDGEETEEYQRKRLIADAWCAAFVMKKYLAEPGRESSAVGITQGNLNDLANGLQLPEDLYGEIKRIIDKYKFFHWHLSFPQVYGRGGFDCVLGNPPWERVNLEARQFFAMTRPDIAEAMTSKRRDLLRTLTSEHPELMSEFRDAQRRAANEIAFFQNSGAYPHLNQARVNTYILFAELALRLYQKSGRCGLVAPSGVATDDTAKDLFSFLVRNRRLASLLDFENREALFLGVDRRYKFCLLTLFGENHQEPPRFAFFLCRPEQLQDESRFFSLDTEEFELLSPLTGLCPTFRYKQDKELTMALYRHVKPLIRQKDEETDWLQSDFFIMFRSDDSAHLYRTMVELGVREPDPSSLPRLPVEGDVYVPVWESKLLHQFDHRFASFVNVSEVERRKGNSREVDTTKKDASWIALPRYWVSQSAVKEALPAWSKRQAWTLGYRDITNGTNERTAIASCLPEGGAAQPLNLFLPESGNHGILWLASMNSLVVDYVARQRIGGVHLNITTCRQLPVIGPASISFQMRLFVSQRAIELVFTSPALEAFARDCGYDGPPFRWDEERRFLVRCELDAAFFHLYLGSEEDWRKEPESLIEAFPTPRHAVDYIMETFPIVKRKDLATYGSYRTKDTILEIYDALADAISIGQPYQTRLNPRPGPPADAEGRFIPASQWDLANWPFHVHQPKRVPIEEPEEIPFEKSVNVIYPATNTDRAICAAALSIVEQSPGSSSSFHIDVLLLSTHPDWCRAFLSPEEQAEFGIARKSAIDGLFVGDNQSIGWKDCRDYLEQQLAILINRNDRDQSISLGPNADLIKASLPEGAHVIVGYAIEAVKRIAEMRRDLSSIPETQKRTINALENQHLICQHAV